MQPSSLAAELISVIQQEHSDVPPIIFLFTDGGPDH